jgi:iron complex transport system substrate-binding protein
MFINFARIFRPIVACLLFTLIFATAYLSSCSSSKIASENDVRPVTDDLGRTVIIPTNITRVVSLAPNLTELVFAVGAGDKLVGVTTYCNYPPQAKEIAKVGDTQAPNIETIIALKPDLVLISTASQLEGTLSQLERQRIPVFVVAPKNLEDIVRSIRTFGKIFDIEDKAERAAVEVESQIRSVSENTSKREKPRVFMQISRDPLFTIGADSFLIDIIEKAGGEPVTKQIPTAYPRLSRETAAALKPDVIILTTSEDNAEPNDAFSNSPAMLRRKIYRLDADILSRPGPRSVIALSDIARLLHPDMAISQKAGY